MLSHECVCIGIPSFGLGPGRSAGAAARCARAPVDGRAASEARIARLSVAVVAPRAHFLAAFPGVECVVCPLDLGVFGHVALQKRTPLSGGARGSQSWGWVRAGRGAGGYVGWPWASPFCAAVMPPVNGYALPGCPGSLLPVQAWWWSFAFGQRLFPHAGQRRMNVLAGSSAAIGQQVWHEQRSGLRAGPLVDSGTSLVANGDGMAS